MLESDEGDNDGTVERALELAESGKTAEAAELLDELGPNDRAWLFAHMDAETRSSLVGALPARVAAEFVHGLGEEQAAGVIEDLEPEEAARIVLELESAERADLLAMLDTDDTERILTFLQPDQASETRTLLAYPADTAGGLMVTEVLRFQSGVTVRDVLDDLREGADTYGDYNVQYAYVVDADGALLGVLRQRDLLFAQPAQQVTDVMIPGPAFVRVDATLSSMHEFFDEHGFVGAPVLDADDRLVGVVRRFAVEEAMRRQMNRLYQRLSGIIGGDELRSMPLRERAVRRLSWLSTNIVLNILAASIIAAHQDTLQAAIVLAVFLPMISDMSGCSGNQAVAVSLRELTLGVVRPREIGRVIVKELSVGIVNGMVLGTLLGVAAGLWKSNPWLGIVVGGALAVNTVIAVAIGGAIPLILRRFRLDPALASGPLLTTVTDMCGFMLVLTLASSVIERL